MGAVDVKTAFLNAALDDEADGIFAEPGVFVIRPDGSVQIVAISNGPAARPDLAELLDGSIFNLENDRPYRGTTA